MTGHPAGLRTHMLIGLAAAVYAILTLQLIESYGDAPSGIELNPIGLVEATTTGVAFLAAGTIFLGGQGGVKGLTTAAVMWDAAAIGLSVGLGPIAFIVVVLVLVISFVLKALTRRLNDPPEE